MEKKCNRLGLMTIDCLQRESILLLISISFLFEVKVLRSKIWYYKSGLRKWKIPERSCFFNNTVLYSDYASFSAPMD